MALAANGKKWVTLIVMLALVWTGAVAASPSASAATTPFSDVPSGHWAEKHIAKLALQGIVKGNEGKFDLNGSVTRQDAVIMALRLLGLESEVDSDKVVAYPSTFQVSNYASSYVDYAFTQGLINRNEEYALAEKESGSSWGATPATREWIARLLVRAVGKEADAAAAKDRATTFNDNSAIDTSMLGYVNAAVSLGLVKGTDGNKFDPKGKVSRATAATLISRAEPLVETAYPGQASGIWIGISAGQLTMLHADGSMTTYAVSDKTLFSRFDSEKLTSVDSLTLYGKALVIGDGAGGAAYVEQTDDTPQVKTVEGKLIVVNTTKYQVSLLSGEEVATYDYDPEFPPVVTDAENNALRLADLPADANVNLSIDAIRPNGKIVSISLGQSTVNKSGQGTVVSWDAANRSLTVKDETTGIAESRMASATAKYQKDGNYVGAEVLKVGDTISYEVSNGEVTSIVITSSPVASTIGGTIFKVDTSAKTIQYTETGDDEVVLKFYADNVAVKINGLTDATVADLMSGDLVTMTLNGEGKVASVEVSDSTVVNIAGAVVSSNYDPDSKVLTVKDSSGNPKAFFITDSTRYYMDGNLIDAQAAALMLYKNKKIDIGYIDDRAIKITFIAKYTGTVTANNTTTKTLTLQQSNGTSVTIPYTTPIVEIYGQTSPTFSNIAVGDTVSAILNATQDYVSTIYVQRKVQFEVVSVDSATNKIALKSTSGVTNEWTLGTGTSFLDENGNATGIGKFASGSFATVTMLGNTPTVLKYVPTFYGKVTAVDSAAGTLQIQTNSGAVVSQSVGTSPIVYKDSVVQSSLASVQVNDRVEVRKDEQDRNVVMIVPGVAKTFFRFDGNLLYWKVASISETNNFVRLHPQAYLHDASSTLTTGSFINGNAITIYTLRGQAVEVVKQ
ncbi:S-layer homology domain-containing protein [Cohnella massiliensis]|uniref:S-layer homology domain-containing protein n=1 Tax=Cohnella massiliensis TaxID=1816691 RepID=UPI0009BA1CDC|nr:S-layer homology domain-containing protein [Cohnella massiliensis]